MMRGAGTGADGAGACPNWGGSLAGAVGPAGPVGPGGRLRGCAEGSGDGSRPAGGDGGDGRRHDRRRHVGRRQRRGRRQRSVGRVAGGLAAGCPAAAAPERRRRNNRDARRNRRKGGGKFELRRCVKLTPADCGAVEKIIGNGSSPAGCQVLLGSAGGINGAEEAGHSSADAASLMSASGAGAGNGVPRPAGGDQGRRRAMPAKVLIALARSATALPSVSGGRSSQLSQASARPNTALTIVRSSSSEAGLNSMRTSRPLTATIRAGRWKCLRSARS